MTNPLDVMEADGLVPVFFNANIDTSRSVADALVEGGIGTLEYTNRGPDALTVFEALATDSRNLILGIGSITDVEDARRFVDLGARFVVGPTFDERVASYCRAAVVPYVPGCATLTEIQTATRAGAELVKIFPAAQLGGADFLAAIRQPCPWVRAMPTGGVSLDVGSLRAWFQAGAVSVGIGNALFPAEALTATDTAALVSRVEEAVAMVGEARAK